MKSELAKKQAELNSYDEKETMKALANEESNKNNLEVAIDGYRNEMRDFSSKIEIYKRKILEIQGQIEQKSTEESKRLGILKQRNEEAYQVKSDFEIRTLKVNVTFYSMARLFSG